MNSLTHVCHMTMSPLARLKAIGAAEWDGAGSRQLMTSANAGRRHLGATLRTEPFKEAYVKARVQEWVDSVK